MENEEPGAAPQPVGAGAAMPQPRPEEDTDLSSGPAEVETTMEESELTEEQIQKSNEPDFMAALEARQEAKEHAETAPAEFRAQEEETLGQAREGAEVAAAAKLEGMHGSRVQALAKVAGPYKGETKIPGRGQAGEGRRRHPGDLRPHEGRRHEDARGDRPERSTRSSPRARRPPARSSRTTSRRACPPTRRSATAAGAASCGGPRTSSSACPTRSTRSTRRARAPTCSGWRA